MKKNIIRLIIGAVFYILALVINLDNEHVVFTIIKFLIPLIIVGGDVLLRAVKNIFRGKVFDENFLMTIAVIGAFLINEYPEAVAVMLFYQLGELFQKYAVDKSRKSIASLMDIRPDFAMVLENDELIKKDPEDVLEGDIIVISPGERVPLDSVVIEGSSSLDTSALTGESIPRDTFVGADILSGCINLNGKLTARVIKSFSESTVVRILDLVENASTKKSKSENFITKFASVYSPIVVFIAVFLALIPPLFLRLDWSTWIYRALTFLVVSCPCALVVSVPMSFFGGLGGASKNGVLIKGSIYLEELAKTETIVFDKTGTLTRGVFEVIDINPQNDLTGEELIEIAAHVENYSTHPIASSIKRAFRGKIDLTLIGESKEIAGFGMETVYKDEIYFAGKAELMKSLDVLFSEKEDLAGAAVHISKGNQYLGSILIADTNKCDAKDAITGLKRIGIKKTVMLTGDVKKVADKVGSELGIDYTYSNLLPDQKLKMIEDLLNKNTSRGTLAFVGDGINDAPALARADIGIAMGGLGSDAAIEAADVVLMTDEPSKLIKAISVSRKTLNIAKQNIIFALGIKASVLILSAFGLVSMWIAVFADVGVCFLAVLNALRALGSDKA
ncbi:MAG: cadmium-translocating P-type ATPase [Christensenellaceae bacterium]|jgi:Cd2+/Zn2+-exporting ATPase|nr:cadmium-translocating P-type ATPase [Christensenellaceae bacterium]